MLYSALRSFTLVSGIGLVLVVQAQAPGGYDWVIGHATTGRESALATRSDPGNGAIYTVGEISNASMFPGIPAIYGGTDAYLARFDLNGTLQWAVRVGSSNDDAATGVDIDQEGNVYICGYFRGSATFSGTNASLGGVLSSLGNDDIFVASFTSDGEIRWVKKGGGNYDDNATGIAVAGNRVVITGKFRYPATIAGQAAPIATNNSKFNAYIAAYDLLGNEQWLVTGVSDEDDQPTAIAYDGMNVYATGVFGGAQMRWYSSNGSLAATRTAPTSGNMYAVAYSSDGIYQWLNGIDDPDSSGMTALGIAVGCNSVYITGNAHYGSSFGGDTPINVDASIHDHFYLTGFNKVSGVHQWTATGISTGGDHLLFGTSLTVDRNDGIYVGGAFISNATFRSASGASSVSVSGFGNSDGFVTKYTNNGLVQWAMSSGGQEADRVNGITTDKLGAVVAVGQYIRSATFTPLTLPDVSNNANAFVTKLTDDVGMMRGIQERSHWSAPSSPICATGGAIDLNTFLTPSVTGYAASVIAQSGTILPNNILGAANNAGVTMNTAGATITVDLQVTLLEDQRIAIRWREIPDQSGRSSVAIATSPDGSLWNNLSYMPSINGNWFRNSVIELEGNTRFVRLTFPSSPASNAFEVDAIQYVNGSTMGGTWSGTGVAAGGSFDPIGLSGTIPVTYAVGSGFCASETPRILNVLAAPTGGAVSPSNSTFTCPGDNSGSLALIGHLGTIVQWESSTDNFVDHDTVPNTSTTLNYSNLTQTTGFRVRVENDCGSVLSDVATIAHQDDQAPLITCPVDMNLVSDVDNCGAQVAFADPVANDNCSGVTVVQTQGPVSGSVFPVGSTTVEFTATDAAGNSSICSFVVTVSDASTCGCGLPQPGDACDDGNASTGSDMIQPDCACAGLPIDCNNEPGGTAFLDNCATCVGGSTGLTACTQDCNGDWGGTAFLDNCVTCVGGTTGLSACAQDCNGDWGGTAFLDNCATCVGGNTGLTACTQDCNGEWGGTAFFDNCASCVGGNTGVLACVQDCDGIWGGSAFIDNCGNCADGVAGIPPCQQDCSGLWGGNAQPGTPCDDGSIATENDLWDIDCNCSGTPITCTSDAGPDQLICGTTVQMQATGDGIWIIPFQLDIDDNTSPNALVSAPWAGVFDLVWEVSIPGCTARDTVTIEFAHVPDPGFNYAQHSLCAGASAIVPTVNEEGGVFSATNGSNIHQVTGSFNPMNSAPGTYEITYSFGGVCPTSSTSTITITPIPDASWTAPNSLCSNNAPLPLASLVTGLSGGSWSGNGVVDGELVPSLINGNSTITYSVSASGCTNSVAHSISVIPAPLPQAGTYGPVCGLTAQLEAQGTGTWSVPSGFQINDSNAANAVVIAPSNGAYDLIWTMTTNGCSASDTSAILFQDIPDASFSYAQSIYCTGDMPPSPWIAQDGGQFTTSAADLDLDPSSGAFIPGSIAPGIYEITYSIGGECPASSTVELTIASSPSAAWSVPEHSCSGDAPIALDPLIIGSTGGQWSGNGIVDGMFDPSLVQGSATIQYEVTVGTCSSSQLGTIPVTPSPQAFAGEDLTVCGLSQGLQAGPYEGTGTWQFPEGLILTPHPRDPQATVTSMGAGSFILTWTVANDGCSASDEMVLTLLDPAAPIWVDAGDDQVLDARDHTTLTGSATNGSFLFWEIIQGSGSIDEPSSGSINVSGMSTGENLLVLTATLNECASASDTVIVHVRDLFIPQGFSPNADGVNDVFEITGIKEYPDSELMVFNRWGQEVFRSGNYDGTWDGRSNNGGDLPNDTYFFVLNLSDGPSYNGHVIIKR